MEIVKKRCGNIGEKEEEEVSRGKGGWTEGGGRVEESWCGVVGVLGWKNRGGWKR